MIYEIERTQPVVKPVLKWVGGKRELLPELRKIYQNLEFNNYFELFVGGGSVYLDIVNLFGVRITNTAVINDVNSDLIMLYKNIKNNPNEIISYCKSLEKDLCKYGYYHIRNRYNGVEENGNLVEKYYGVLRSASMIILNRTCFNGLYRTNKKGLFNVPQGKYNNPKIVDENNLLLLSTILPRNENITNKQFYEVEGISKGDFVYMDPPYHPINETSSFTNYSGEFGLKEQIKLRDYFRELDEKGVYVLQSNSACSFIKDIYSGFKIIEVECSRNINSKGEKRGKVKEYIILGNTLKQYHLG